MGEHPASAVRSKRDSSMAVGVDLVKKGAADCFVSAGNTGGVLATALLGLRRIEGITSERPALAAQLPTTRGTCVMLDVGANVDVKPEWLAQFALMGSIYAEVARQDAADAWPRCRMAKRKAKATRCSPTRCR